MKKISAILLLLLAFSGTLPMTARSGENLTDEEVSARLTYIQGKLDSGERAANTWWYGWIFGYAALTAGQTGYYFYTGDRETKQDMLVGSATSILGIAGQLIDDMEPGYLPSELRAIPGQTPDERRTKLIEAENFLRLSAEREADGRSWFTHALAIAVNAGAGLFLCRYYGRPAVDGFITFAAGQAISEIQIFTQPVQAIDDYRDYRNRFSNNEAASRSDTVTDWYVLVFPGGFVTGIRF